MRAYTPSKKQLPSWMMMNETKHWLTSNNADLEINWVDTSDGIDFPEEEKLTNGCKSTYDWQDPRGSACDRVSFMKPELKLRHLACDEEAKGAGGVNGYVPSTRRGPHVRMCRMTSSRSEKVYPEYEKCFKPGGMDGPNALDCRKACYTFPEQPGCEAIYAETKDLWDVSKTARDAIRTWKTPEPVREQINILRYAERDAARPPPTPAPEETVVIAASMRSVTPTSIQFAYVDPKTKKSVIAKKTLVDLYKPTDKVSVVLGKNTSKFVGLSNQAAAQKPVPTPAPAPVPNRVVAGIVVKVLSTNQVQIKYTKPDGKLIIMTTVKNAHNMKLNEAIKVNLNSAAPYAFISIAKK